MVRASGLGPPKYLLRRTEGYSSRSHPITTVLTPVIYQFPFSLLIASTSPQYLPPQCRSLPISDKDATSLGARGLSSMSSRGCKPDLSQPLVLTWREP